MSQNYLILILFIEIALAYLIVISIKKANKWVMETQEIVDDLAIRAPEELKNFRTKLRNLTIR